MGSNDPRPPPEEPESGKEDNGRSDGENYTEATVPAVKHRWWKPLRGLLLVVEAGAALGQHDALAITARTLVLIGDVIFG